MSDDWRTWAACADTDFFGDEKAAKAVCGTCPVKPACLDYVLEITPVGELRHLHSNPRDTVIWAGMNGVELNREARARVRREWRRRQELAA